MQGEILKLCGKIGAYEDLHKRLKDIRKFLAEDKYMLIADNYMDIIYDATVMSYKTGATVVDKGELLSLYKMSVNDGGIVRSRTHLYNEMNKIYGEIQEMKERIIELSED